MADLSTPDINDLPDSDFAYIEPGGKKDRSGRTTPRSLRHFPIHDAAHVRNALARAPQSPFGTKAMPKIRAAAARFSIDVGTGKAAELKAEPMTSSQLDRWLHGLIPRRLLAIPFGGPIPSPRSPRGVDLDGEWFSERTDLYDGHKALLDTRERLVDWHHVVSDAGHSTDPAGGRMKGAILGRIVIDEEPEDDGYWVDFWANAGERRLALVRQLEERGAKLFGSSHAPYRKADPDTGEILVWPWTFQTLSTSPQNTLAVLPPLKALLAAPNFDEISGEALKAALLGFEASDLELPPNLRGMAVDAAMPAGEGVATGTGLSTQTLTALDGLIGWLRDHTEYLT